MCNFHVKVFNSTQNDMMINYPKDLIDRSIINTMLHDNKELCLKEFRSLDRAT